VFDDRLQELEVDRAENATERFEVLDRQRRLAGVDVFAGVDRFEAIFEVATVGGLDLNVECLGHGWAWGCGSGLVVGLYVGHRT